jgi:trimethylamine:corrinoid methyltransferase-like protein
MLSFLIAAAAPSKTPFYIAGAVLVLWAVVLAGVGLAQPKFPGSARRARGVMTISLVLVVIAIAAGILTDP